MKATWKSPERIEAEKTSTVPKELHGSLKHPWPPPKPKKEEKR